MPEEKPSQKLDLGPEFWTLLKVVTAIWCIGGFMTFVLTDIFDTRVALPKSGLFGDTFGAVNSLFSALGLAGVIYALILQIREQRRSEDEETKSREHSASLSMLASLIDGKAAASSFYRGVHAANIEAYWRIDKQLWDTAKEIEMLEDKLDEYEKQNPGINVRGWVAEDQKLLAENPKLWGELTLIHGKLKRAYKSMPVLERSLARTEVHGKNAQALTSEYIIGFEALLLYAEDRYAENEKNWESQKPEYMKRAKSHGVTPPDESKGKPGTENPEVSDLAEEG